MEPIYNTREEWLMAATERMRSWFDDHGAPLPKKISVSCGFPLGSKRAIGQAWDKACTSDETTHIFISPRLHAQDDLNLVSVLATHLHELCHAALGNKEGHGKKFVELARKKFGLAGRITATYAETDSPLYNRLLALGKTLGAYPHSQLNPAMLKKEKDSDRKGEWVRMISPNNEKYTAVVSKKNLEEFGPPVDPWGEVMVPKNQDE